MITRARLMWGAVVVLFAIAIGSVVWSQTASEVPEQTTVTFHLDSDFGSSLIRVAAANGSFKKFGIDAEIIDHPNGLESIRELLATPTGEIALATSSGGSFVSFLPTNRNIKIISQLANDEDSYYWLVSQEIEVGSVLDLKGLRIGYPEISGYRTFLQLSLEDHGLSEDDVTLVPLDSSQFPAAMADGLIDAHPSRALLTEQTLSAVNGLAYELHDIGAYDWFNVLSSTDRTIRFHPEVLEAVLNVLQDTQVDSYESPAEAREIVAESLGLDLSAVPEDVMNSSNVRLSNGLLRQLEVNRRLLTVDLGLSTGAFFSDPREFINAEPLLTANPMVVHID